MERGLKKQNGPRAIGKARRGWNTKIHMVAADARTVVFRIRNGLCLADLFPRKCDPPSRLSVQVNRLAPFHIVGVLGEPRPDVMPSGSGAARHNTLLISTWSWWSMKDNTEPKPYPS